MKKSLYLLSILVAGLLLNACSPYSLVNTETYQNADLASYSTFRIITPSEGKIPPGMQLVTYYNIAAAIREQMLERGYTESPDSPLLINIGLTVNRGIVTEPIGNLYYPYGPGPGPAFAPFFMYPRAYYWPPINPNTQVVTGIYREGVLTMDMVNIDRKVPLYTSSVATVLSSGQGNGFQTLKGIAEAVQTLFSKFPVPMLPQYKK